MSKLADAHKMLDTFVRVGATAFDVTFLDIDGAKRGFRKEQSAAQLRNSLPKLFPGLTDRQNNLIIRPLSDTVTFVQLDDLGSDALARVESVAFLTFCTSPGNHQAWVAISGAPGKDFARRLKKGKDADPSASGSTRLAGTVNYKRKYEPDFPTVTIVSAIPGRIVTPEQLEVLGLLAAAEPPPERAASLSFSASGDRRWPDYQRCLAGAPLNSDGTGPDRSKADYTFCKFAAQRGFTVEEIAAELPNVSEKARERIGLRDPGYVTVTAENGAAAVAGNRQARAR